MCTQVKMRATTAILPPELIGQIERPKFNEDTNEKIMMAVATLVVNLIRETILYIREKQPKRFDAYPGDRICQARLIVLPQLFENPEVSNELNQLMERITLLLQALKERRRSKSCPPAEFFNKITALEISNNAHYLLDCRLLMVTRATQRVESNGVVQSRADCGQLTALSPDIYIVDSKLNANFREQITNNACMRISAQSMVYLQERGRQMKVSPLLQRMVDLVLVFQPKKEYPPKTFGCQFFTMQLALQHLLQSKTLIAIKTIVPKDKVPSFIFFRAGEKDFEQEKEIVKTPYLAIFHAVVPSKDALMEKIKEIGFIELILRLAAQEAPLNHESTLEDVKDPEGRQVLLEYKEKAAKSGCSKDLLLLHHLYSNTFQEELK